MQSKRNNKHLHTMVVYYRTKTKTGLVTYKKREKRQ